MPTVLLATLATIALSNALATQPVWCVQDMVAATMVWQAVGLVVVMSVTVDPSVTGIVQ